MPIHDWTRVTAGTWHDHHVAWIAELRNALNAGLLPDDYYAQAEQFIGPFEPDVVALHAARAARPAPGGPIDGGLTVATAPPRPRLRDRTEWRERPVYAARGRNVVVRHASGDRIVALIELVSPGNKGSETDFRALIDKINQAIRWGYHLLIVDLFPPTPRDPPGLHSAVRESWGEDPYPLPPDEPLTLVAYAASGRDRVAYIEPTAVGRDLIEMPLFLDPETYVNVPLEETYRRAYRGVPRRWKEVLEAGEAERADPPAAG